MNAQMMDFVERMGLTLELVGTLPIALGQGAGAESRHPLGVAVVGGLLFSQISYLDAWQQRMARKKVKESLPYAEPRAGEATAAGARG